MVTEEAKRLAKESKEFFEELEKMKLEKKQDEEKV